MTDATEPAPMRDIMREHVSELPFVRRGIVAAIQEFSGALPAGTRVLDAGAGNAPYAELFAHCRYTTADWGNSVHEGAASADIIASLDALPVPDDSFDAVLCTEVLEHVRDPQGVVGEFSRVLTSGGRLCVTVPFVWPLHEEPYDFFRYTPYALHDLLERHGFADVKVAPTSGFMTTLAQIAAMSWWAHRGSDAKPVLTKRVALRLLRLWSVPLVAAARRSAVLDNVLVGVELPLGFRVTAAKRAAPSPWPGDHETARR